MRCNQAAGENEKVEGDDSGKVKIPDAETDAEKELRKVGKLNLPGQFENVSLKLQKGVCSILGTIHSNIDYS